MECLDCHGSGLLDEREQPPIPCPSCGGTGKIEVKLPLLSDEEIRNIWLGHTFLNPVPFMRLSCQAQHNLDKESLKKQGIEVE